MNSIPIENSNLDLDITSKYDYKIAIPKSRDEMKSRDDYKSNELKSRDEMKIL